VEFSADISDQNDVQLKLIQKILPSSSGSNIIGADDFTSNTIEILERIGSGNFGSVFRGKMGMTPVAVKKLNSFDTFTLLEEAKMLYLLRSPFIVQFLGVFEKGDEWFLITEFLPKGSLEQFLLKKNRTIDTLLSMLITGGLTLEKMTVVFSSRIGLFGK
jgi:serine/threonine protein kinase